ELRRFTIRSQDDEAGERRPHPLADVAPQRLLVYGTGVVKRRGDGRVDARESISSFHFPNCTRARPVPWTIRFTASTTAKIPAAGARIQGASTIKVTLAASCSMVPQVGVLFGKP